MNVTELARRLKVPTNELLEMLPAMGFDIGKKAIKINDSLANKIMRDWRFLYGRYKKQQEDAQQKEEVEKNVEEKKVIMIPEYISIKDFAQLAGIPVTRVLTELMKSGILSSLNEKIDFDTASIVGQDLGIEIEKSTASDEKTNAAPDEQEEKEETKNLKERPPVVVIMGHVDHGKTKLLDTIRKSNIIDSESGGITQHIGAYQIIRNGKTLTFIDTPGHEAFSTMRSRGAKIADIAILIIAADDGIKPQTKESIKIIRSGKLPMIVAINKIDKPEANIEKVKQELAQENLLPEDWGGNIICVPISAKEGKNIDDLLDTITLIADMEKDNIVANPDRPATGTIIESHKDKGEGVVATLLVKNGTLKKGDLLFSRGVHYGKIRTLKNFLGETIDSATPSTPVKIIGLKAVPAVGDILEVHEHVERKNRLKNYQLQTQAASAYSMQTNSETSKNDNGSLNLIIRTDVLGSLEAIISSIDKIQHPDIKIHIILKGLGNVTENDILLAESNNAHILAFHVSTSPAATSLCHEKNIQVHSYKIIYKLIDDVREMLESMLSPEVRITEIGKVKILKVFKKNPDGMVIGGQVIEGVAAIKTKAEVLREDVPLGRGEIQKLQSSKIDVKEVGKGEECGIQYFGKPIIEEGDTLRIFKEETIKKKLES